MTFILSSPHLADLVLAVFAIEAVVIAWLWRAKQRGLSPAQFWPTAMAGVMLVIALRFALAGVQWPWIGLCLAGAGLAHAVDVWMRWR